MKAHIEKATEAEFNKVKCRHQEKLRKWIEKRDQRKKMQHTEDADLSGTQLKKWVVNLSKYKLSSDENKVLARGLNFAITLPKHPVDDLIVSAEKSCALLPYGEGDQLRAKLVSVIKSSKPPTPNISKGEYDALTKLGKLKEVTILPADKGRATVVMDTVDYEEKVQTMLSDDKTYAKVKRDPTQTYKRKLVGMLTKLMKNEKITERQKTYLYPTSESIPRLYCTPKIHKPNNPLRPIVDYTGSIAYNVSRSLADLLNPLVGKTEHHVKNSKDLVEKLKPLNVKETETLVSFDVVSLFTNTPIDSVLEIVKRRLSEDNNLKCRTRLSVEDIMDLLEFVLTTTYFSFRKQIYQQKFGTAMGSPVSPLVANLFMEDLEQRAISTAPLECKPRFWVRYVDDVLAIIPKGQVQQLNEHLNTMDHTGNIKFTNESMEEDHIPFLDADAMLLPDGSLTTKVYRKATHTNQYLSFESHHPTTHKLSVVRTLLDRCETLVMGPEDKAEEEKTITQALTTCGYPKWTFRRVKKQLEQRSAAPKGATTKKKEDSQKSRGHIVLPYVSNLSEKMATVLKTYNISSSYKPHTTIKQRLVHPKDKVEKEDKCGCVYQISCSNCKSVYIGETGRKFGIRCDEHKKDVEDNANRGVNTRAAHSASVGDLHKSAITDHMVDKNHVTNWKETRILAREENPNNRRIRESIWIRRNPTNMNRDEGAHRLSHLYDELINPRPPEGGRGGTD